MNLKSIGISNFKAFGKELQTVPIKPITLVFGPNSAGKSSLLHSLLWLNHATTRGETDVFHPTLSGEAVNLGGFEQCLNRKSGEQRLKISLTMENEIPVLEPAGWRLNASTFRLELHFGRILRDKDPTLVSCDLYADEQLLLRCWTCNAEKSWVEAKVEWGHPSLGGIIPQHEIEEHASFAEYRLHCNGMMPSHIELDVDGPGGLLMNAKIESLGVAFSFLAKELPEQFAEIFTGFNSVMGGMQYLPPLREIPKREMDLRSCKLPGWRWIDKNPSLVKRVNDTLALMGVGHSVAMRDLIPTGFLETAILHLVTQAEDRQKGLASAVTSALQDWNALSEDGLRHWMNRHPALREKIVEMWYREIRRNRDLQWEFQQQKPLKDPDAIPPEWWLQEAARELSDNDSWMDPGTEECEWATTVYISEDTGVKEALAAAFADKKFGKMKSLLVEHVGLRLWDKKADAWVSLQDVGVGTSQSLPVILEAYGQYNKLIAIEQPELHLHPRLQSELGDVFIESALGENKNTFLLETHSEHLLLRVMKRMRQTADGTLPDGLPPVRPEDVALLYVSPGPEGRVVQDIGLNERGELIKAWPGGFFEEGFNEMFD